MFTRLTWAVLPLVEPLSLLPTCPFVRDELNPIRTNVLSLAASSEIFLNLLK